MTKDPYYWIKNVEDALVEAKKIPLWGHPPLFPWDDFARHLSKQLHLLNLHISSQETRFLQHDHLLSGMGNEPIICPIELTPLEGVIHWILPQDALHLLVRDTLSGEKQIKGFSDQSLQEGYYTYLLLEIMHSIDKLKVYNTLSAKLAHPTPLPQEGGLCTDISISWQDQTVWGRLICPSAFLHSFRTFFGTRQESISTSPLADEIEVDVQCHIGSTTLSLKELQQVVIGDFILLDRCHFDPITNSGEITLTIDKTPLLRGTFKAGKFSILEQPFYREETTPMAKHHDDEEEDFEEDEDEDLDEEEEDEDEEDEEEEDEEFEEDEDEDEDLDEEDEEEDEEDEEDEEEDEDEEDEDLDEEDEEDEDEEDEEDEDEDLDEDEEEEAEEEGHLWASEETEDDASMDAALSPEEMPITLTVEVARLKMNLRKLLDLKPGNILDLGIHLEEPLNITMNGKCLAKGELLKLGDMLGIKILRIGAVHAGSS